MFVVFSGVCLIHILTFISSLFGNKGAPSDGRAKARETNGKNSSISLTELQRIKDFAAASSSLLQQQIKDDDARDHEKQQLTHSDTANARKEYMRQLELKEIEEQTQTMSQYEQAKLDRIRKQAHEKLVEDHDIVKLLKTCSERATAFAIRDQQLKDKVERNKKEQEYEQRMVLAMEIDRLREIEAREAEEERKMKKMIDGRMIIEEQIEKRHDARLLVEEARDQENREILERIELYRAQDEQKAREKRDNAFKVRIEIIHANEEHVAAQRERKLIEKREDEMMIAMQIEQDEKVREREEKHAEAQRQKQAIHKKLLTEQKRAVDRRSEMDELRERRAVEDAERKFRQRQLMEAQKKKSEVKALDMARIQQQQERYQQQKLVMEQKREEYENAIKHSRAMAERERAEGEYVRRKNIELINNLKEQIEENAKTRMALEKEKIQEGSVIKQQLVRFHPYALFLACCHAILLTKTCCLVIYQANERAKLEAVREKMLNEMKTRGIDSKYFGEIASLDIDRLFMK